MTDSLEILETLSYPDIIGLMEEHGSGRNVAKILGVPRTTLQDYVVRLQAQFFRDRPALEAVRIDPHPYGIKRFVLTAAQDSTNVHEGFLANLQEFCSYYEAELQISPFTYQKKLFEDNRPEKSYYVKEVRPYLVHDRYEIGPHLQWCGEMNTLPTAVSPLSGFESYTQTRSGIFPHVKVQMQSLATPKNALSKVLMTTGCVTKPNYVQRKAGIKAEFHHIYGAVFVELLSDGSYFMRHLMGEKRGGGFQDLNMRLDEGKITFGHRIEAVTHGDIHFEQMDEAVRNLVWYNDGNLVDVLQPRYQFFHDTLDFDNRTYHRIDDPHHQFGVYIRGEESIEDNMQRIGKFLKETERDFSESIVVESNHDRHYLGWLKTADWREDPANAELNLWANAEFLKAIREGRDKQFNVFAETVKRYTPDLNVTFLQEDDSFIICQTDRSGIECGLHGHLGGNGSRGSVRALSKLGPRINSAHTHSPTIYDGAYCAGTYSNLDLGYNRGPSSWSHAAVITYPNGKRTIVQFQNGMWRAPLD